MGFTYRHKSVQSMGNGCKVTCMITTGQCYTFSLYATSSVDGK
jgi:hypothetical protein